MPAESIAFSEVAVRQRAMEKARALRAAQREELEAEAEAPAVQLPDPVARADGHFAPETEERAKDFAQKLARTRYQYALSREESQVRQACVLMKVGALLLVGNMLALVFGYVFSLPEYFLFYLYTCLSPVLFAVSLVLAGLCCRYTFQPCLPPPESGLSARRWCEILADAETLKTSRNDRRGRMLAAANGLLYAGLVNLAVNLVVWICIGA